MSELSFHNLFMSIYKHIHKLFWKKICLHLQTKLNKTLT